MHFFCKMGMTSKRIEKSAKKILFKYKKLCYLIEETIESWSIEISGSLPVGTDRHKIPGNVGFSIWRSYGSSEKQPAYMYSDRKVCLVNILFALVANGYVWVTNSQKLYIRHLAKISWEMYSAFLLTGCFKPMVYFNSLKEVSIPQRRL